MCAVCPALLVLFWASRGHTWKGGRQTGGTDQDGTFTRGSWSTAEGSKWHLLVAFEKQMLNSYLITAVS